MNGNRGGESRVNPCLHLLSLRHEQRESNRYEWHQADWLFAFGQLFWCNPKLYKIAGSIYLLFHGG